MIRKRKMDEKKRACYFCNYNKILHRHHIIRKWDGGTNDEENLIDLCPNCHFLIHYNLYFIQYSNGYFILVSKRSEEKILPYDWRNKQKREIPKKSLKNALELKNLEEREKGKFFLSNSNPKNRRFTINLAK